MGQLTVSRTRLATACSGDALRSLLLLMSSTEAEMTSAPASPCLHSKNPSILFQCLSAFLRPLILFTFAVLTFGFVIFVNVPSHLSLCRFHHASLFPGARFIARFTKPKKGA